MQARQQKRVLSEIAAADLVGRETEIEALRRHAASTGTISLLAEPGAGATELLRTTFDHLFFTFGEVQPFYFQFKTSDRDLRSVAHRFAYEFILQSTAFHNRSSSIMSAAPALDELLELAKPRDIYWIGQLRKALADETLSAIQFAEICFRAPLRASAAGGRPYILLDDLHLTARIEEDLFGLFPFVGISLPVVASGYRRYLYGKIDGRRLDLRVPSFEDAASITERLASRNDLEIDEHCCDLIATQLGGNPASISAFLSDASQCIGGIFSFQEVEELYAQSLFGGALGRRFDAWLNAMLSENDSQRALVGVLWDTASSGSGIPQGEGIERRFGIGERSPARLLDTLDSFEIVKSSSGAFELTDDNLPFRDYIETRFRLEIGNENRAVVYGESLGKFIRRSPEIMAAMYRRKASLGLRSIMATFDGRSVPKALLDYRLFKNEYKGAPDHEILRDVASAETFALPDIYFVADTVSFYRPLESRISRESSAVAMGSESSAKDASEVVWIAAEFDSKLEASREVAEFWCDRLEMAALMCDFPNYVIWLVAPEGFSSDAIELLEARRAIGSSFKQIDLLWRYLGAGETEREGGGSEYELVIPMDGDAELIAANAVEDIARRHNFDQRSINQIKTALVEACINASEHSLSPDKKIYQKLIVGDDRISIIISNRGLRLTDKRTESVEPAEGRRGWGLRLMRQLMDEVNIEKVDDGTRISMTKYLKTAKA